MLSSQSGFASDLSADRAWLLTILCNYGSIECISLVRCTDLNIRRGRGKLFKIMKHNYRSQWEHCGNLISTTTGALKSPRGGITDTTGGKSSIRFKRSLWENITERKRQWCGFIKLSAATSPAGCHTVNRLIIAFGGTEKRTSIISQILYRKPLAVKLQLVYWAKWETAPLNRVR